MQKKLWLIGSLIIIISPILFSDTTINKLQEQPLAFLQSKKVRPVDAPFSNFSNVSIEDLEDFLELDDIDYPTSKAIKNLVQTFWPELGDVTIKKESGGSYTGIIFSASHVVTGTLKKVFFLKVSNNNAFESWKNLQKIQQSKIGQFYGCQTSCSPIITSVEKFFIYKDTENKNHTIEVTHAAKGESASTIMLSAALQDEKNWCAREIGAALATFHRAFMSYHHVFLPESWRTFTHGDFHQGNVFFHKTKDFSRVFFIDNETMAKSLDNPQPIADDVVHFFLKQTESMQFLMNTTDQEWSSIVIFLHHFIKGYVGSYPRRHRERVICYLQDLINKQVSAGLPSIDEIPENTANTNLYASIKKRRARLEMLLILDKDLAWYVLSTKHEQNEIAEVPVDIAKKMIGVSWKSDCPVSMTLKRSYMMLHSFQFHYQLLSCGSNAITKNFPLIPKGTQLSDIIVLLDLFKRL